MTHVLSVAPDASISAAARLMLQNRISGLPVVDGSGKLVGMVTEGDFLRRTEIGTQRRRARWIGFLIGPGRLADEYSRSSGRSVSDVMTHDVHTANADSSLDYIVRTMERHRVKRVPVVEEGKVVGIVTRANLLHALAGIADEIAPSSAGDTAIREQIFAELKPVLVPETRVVLGNAPAVHRYRPLHIRRFEQFGFRAVDGIVRVARWERRYRGAAIGHDHICK